MCSSMFSFTDTSLSILNKGVHDCVQFFAIPKRRERSGELISCPYAIKISKIMSNFTAISIKKYSPKSDLRSQNATSKKPHNRLPMLNVISIQHIKKLIP